MSIEIGDIVKLKSGGPEMTVQIIIGQGESPGSMENFWDMFSFTGLSKGDIICNWFVGQKLEYGYFKPDTLEKVR